MASVPSVAPPAYAQSALCKLHLRVKRLASQVSDPSFIEFDALAIWIYLVAIALYIGASALALNGSSQALYPTASGHGGPAKVILGSPKAIRSDEWAYTTPDILNQYFRADRFGVANSALGSHNVALTGNVPVRDWPTVFRPQFWPFFALPIQYAYACYWQAKELILFCGVFTLLLWLTQSSVWALVGSLWYFFSPMTQWDYSWPSALPEMIGSLCLATVGFAYVTVGRNLVAVLVAAVAASAAAINYAMCAYVPHMIPLAWVAIAAFLAWCIGARSQIFTPNRALLRAIALGTSVVLMGVVALHVYRELTFAIHTVAHTEYPGRRIINAGRMHVWELASQLIPWGETDAHFPAVLPNICESSGYLWLAPLTSLCLRRLTLTQFQKAALAALWACAGLLLAWLLLPLPDAVGHLTGLERTMPDRCTPALGLLDIAIVCVTMTGLRRRGGRRALFPLVSRDLALFAIAWFVFFVLLYRTNHFLADFFSTPEVALASELLAAAAACLLTNRQIAFAACILAPQVVAFGTVNPIERGVGVFTRSPLRQFVAGHSSLLKGKWLAYSDNPLTSGFLSAMGLDVYTGTHYIPDVDHFRLFAARGLQVSALNRLGYLDAVPVASGSPMSFSLESPVVLRWNVAPQDPILQKIGIRYVAFDRKPDSAWLQGLVALAPGPVDNFWLFALP